MKCWGLGEVGTTSVVAVAVVVVVVLVLVLVAVAGGFQFPSKSNKKLSQPNWRDPPLLGGRFCLLKLGQRARYRDGEKKNISFDDSLFVITKSELQFQVEKTPKDPSQFWDVLGPWNFCISPAFFVCGTRVPLNDGGSGRPTDSTGC